MMELAPICVFSYDRPDHLRRTLEALSRNDLARESELYIFCDGPKPIADEGIADVEGANDSARRIWHGDAADYPAYIRRIADNVELAQSQTWPKALHVIAQPCNKGLADSIVDGVTEVVGRHGRIIMIEDDVVTSKGFLRYMNEALELYKDDERVMHISGYMYPHKCRLPQTFFYPVPYPGGGWATWQRAWKHYNNDTAALFKYWDGRWKEFDVHGGDNLSRQLRQNMDGTLKTWYVKWHAVLMQRGALTLYPGQSLTNNIGFDSSATNCYATNKFDVAVVDSVKVLPVKVKTDKRAARVIYDFYQGHWYNRRRRRAFFAKLAFWKKQSSI